MNPFGVIEKISREQADQGQKFYRDWKSAILSTHPVDRDKAEQGLCLAYESVGIPAPRVVWHASPLKAIVNAALLISRGYSTVVDQIVNKPLDQGLDKLKSEISWRVNGVLERELKNKLFTELSDISSAVAQELSIRAMTVEDRDPKLGSVLQKLIELSVDRFSGQFAIYDYADKVLNIRSNHLRGLTAAALIGWYWPFEAVVLASEGPTRIALDDTGKPHDKDFPAIKFSDDFGVHCWRGVRVPREAISNLREVEWRDVEVTADKNVQEALTEMKARAWSASDGQKGASEEERYEAAMAVKRLGGIASVRGLVEEEE